MNLFLRHKTSAPILKSRNRSLQIEWLPLHNVRRSKTKASGAPNPGRLKEDKACRFSLMFKAALSSLVDLVILPRNLGGLDRIPGSVNCWQFRAVIRFGL
jgi:hypothetical protein